MDRIRKRRCKGKSLGTALLTGGKAHRVSTKKGELQQWLRKEGHGGRKTPQAVQDDLTEEPCANQLQPFPPVPTAQLLFKESALLWAVQIPFSV